MLCLTSYLNRKIWLDQPTEKTAPQILKRRQGNIRMWCKREVTKYICLSDKEHICFWQMFLQTIPYIILLSVLLFSSPWIVLCWYEDIISIIVGTQLVEPHRGSTCSNLVLTLCWPCAPILNLHCQLASHHLFV